MNRILLLISLLAITTNITAQKSEYFKPYKTTDLRLPAVPLVVNDPYFSIWSPYDKLTEGPTQHWTGADKPLVGMILVDGACYQFMGAENRSLYETIMPMAEDKVWEAPYTMEKPAENWAKPEFDDSAWKKGKGAFGTDKRRKINTDWSGDNTDLYVRRIVELTEKDLKDQLILQYSFDDYVEIYVNGHRIIAKKGAKTFDASTVVDEQIKYHLHPGKNVIAAHCHNTDGRAYLDYGLYRDVVNKNFSVLTAKQLSVDVTATSTYYSFECGNVLLDLVFTAPMLIDDLDLLSTPINYISYQVRAKDGRKHNVSVLLATTPELAMNNVRRGIVPVTSTIVSTNRGSYVKSGTLAQPVLKLKGDGVCIDWGYLYFSDHDGYVGIAPYLQSLLHFVKGGRTLHTNDSICVETASKLTAITYTKTFRQLGSDPESAFTMIGYDEVKDIEYLGEQYKAYWAHGGKVTILDAFAKLRDNYDEIMQRCRNFDKLIYDDGFRSGGKLYAEMLSGSYRHVIAAHKLFEDKEGNLLFFSKENNSNGSVNTVDLTYPSAPLFLVYNPELQKAMMTSIFEYSRSGRWTKPFAAHDMGTYPIANGQTYKGDMPLEESGNMIILAAMISMLDGNTNYVDKYWEQIKLWNNYLVEHGQDPETQLCTDDFAGHWPHNCNLSVKAILGIMGYSKMAEMKGLTDEAKEYSKLASKMAAKWEKDARYADHYKLSFDRDSTWSQKYNMIWDKIWQTNIFPHNAMQKEVAYYLTQQNNYGLPLDCRKDYTKSDWIMWTAAMADNPDDFHALMEPVYGYMHETTSRVPHSDWYDTKTSLMQAFIGRSVVGGYWMKVFADKFIEKTKTKKKK